MSLIIENRTNALDLSFIAGEKRKRYPSGSCIYFQEDPSGLPLVIAEGAVKLSVLSPKGQQTTLGLVKPPEILIDGCLSDGRRSSDAYAVNETTVIPVSFNDLSGIPDFDVLSYLLTQTARQLRERTERYRELTTLRIKTRLARFLLREFCGKEMFETTATQSEISYIIGASRESTNSNLGLLKEKEIIGCRKSRMVTHYQVLNPEGLMKLAKFID